MCQRVELKHEYFSTAFLSWTGNIHVADPNPQLENCMLSHSRLLWCCNIWGEFSSVLPHKKLLYINHRLLKNHTLLLQALYKAIVKDRKFVVAELKILFHPQQPAESLLAPKQKWDKRWREWGPEVESNCKQKLLAPPAGPLLLNHTAFLTAQELHKTTVEKGSGL